MKLIDISRIKNIKLNRRLYIVIAAVVVVVVGSLIGYFVIKPGSTSVDKSEVPVILSFSSNPETVDEGELTNLTWDVSNATSVIIEPEIGSVALSGSTSVRTTEDTVFTLTAKNNAGSAEATTRVFVSGQALAPGASTGFEGKIVFKSDRDGNEEVYVMNADGSNPTNISNNSAYDGEPTWSPDNSKIAFRSGRDGNQEIYVMNADGSNQINLSNNNADDAYPAWSPDDTRIAFRSNRDGNWEIYVMDADGSNQYNLSNNSANDAYPAWSPDGSKIAFRSNRDDNYEIYVMSANGSSPINLSNNPADDAYPAWSPDGSKIAFRSNRDGNYEIYVMNADGSNQTNVSPNDARDNYPSWSPDGTKIVFMSDRDASSEVYVMNADGSNPTNISLNDSHDAEPAWSRTGVIIAPLPAGPKPSGPKPVIDLFAAEPGQVGIGGSSTLQWQVSDAARVSISPEIGDISQSGTMVVYPPESTTYTITASNANGTSTATAAVMLIEPEKPDLVVAAMEFSGGMVNYTITNEGMAAAGASTSLLQIDETDVATDTVPPLAPGASSARSFSYPYSCSDAQDDIVVTVDDDNLIDEMNEENNEWYDSWLCQVSLFGSSTPTVPFPSIPDISKLEQPHFPQEFPGQQSPGLPQQGPEPLVHSLPRYIMVTLESVTILDDKDPAGCGEIQMWFITSTGETHQTTSFPVSKYYESSPYGVNSNITINQPIFCLKEDEMDDDLAITIVVVDNDTRACWVGANPFSIGRIFDVYTKVVAAMVPGEENTVLERKVGNTITNWLDSADHIGTCIRKFAANSGWGADTSAVGTVRHYSHGAGDMQVNYRIDYIESPRELDKRPGRQVEVHLYPIRIRDDGDGWPKGKGDIFVYSRVYDGFKTASSSVMLPNEYIVRMPKRGTTDKDDGDQFGVSWPSTGKLIMRDYFPGPFIFVEVDVWDKDDPLIGDSDDMLGIFSDCLIIPEEPGTYRMHGHREGIDEGDISVEIQVVVMGEIP